MQGWATVRLWAAGWRGHVEDSGPHDVIPSRLARRRARWGLGILLGVWAGFDVAIGILVRAHGINERCTGYSMGAGGTAWFLVFPAWFGRFRRRHRNGRSGRYRSSRGARFQGRQEQARHEASPLWRGSAGASRVVRLRRVTGWVRGHEL